MQLSACFITILGLVSVACAVPLHTLTARHNSNPRFKITFLDQNDPLQSITQPQKHKAAPVPKIVKFFENQEIITALGYKTDARILSRRISWEFWTHDTNYMQITDKDLPVYLEFIGGFSGGRGAASVTCVKGCLAVIGGSSESPYGMIASPDRFIGQLGNPAIVSFTNWQSREAPSNPDPKTSPANPSVDPDHLARRMVDSFLTDEKVIKELGFTATPKIIRVDSFPVKENDLKVHFQFRGGTKCSRKPCFALVEFDHLAKPEPVYKGSIYNYDHQPGHSGEPPIVEWTLPIKGGAEEWNKIQAQAGH